MRVCSLNTGGGRPVLHQKADQGFAYAPQDIPALASFVVRANADAICLQETLLNSQQSLAHDLAAYSPGLQSSHETILQGPFDHRAICATLSVVGG
ncbi:MAG TPA: endonuclease/exonuclease/phosphatase family protein [Candidatus Acidoferrum sp.]|nr:endonuclease/exonuclease/phosphatase family protein [Candidatus Acidoferrum sp.]